MKIRIALTIDNLRAYKPRGVARVARALAEEIARDSRFEAFAIGHLSFDRVDIVADHWRLVDYLERVPLDLATLADSHVPSKDRKGQVIDQLCHWFSWLLLPQVSMLGLRLCRNLGIYNFGRGVYRAIRSRVHSPYSNTELAQAESAVPGLGPISLNHFDAVVSSEIFEGFWVWPTETLRCRTILLAYDLIPLRIYEGEHGRPAEFFCKAGTAALRADKIACISQATERDFNALYPASIGKTFVAHLGHDDARFAAARESLLRQPRAELWRILMIGDMDRRKNLQTVLRAMPLLASRCGGRAIELVVLGNAARRHEFAYLERIAKKHATIRWVGYQSDEFAAKMTAESDVVLMPSLWEGFGIPVLEAMSAGVPVVCSCLSSLPEVGGQHAIYCDPYDPGSIAEGIAQVLTMDESARRAHIEGAIAWARPFTWQRCMGVVATEILRLTHSGSATVADAPQHIAPNNLVSTAKFVPHNLT